jgi:hypothetical protein
MQVLGMPVRGRPPGSYGPDRRLMRGTRSTPSLTAGAVNDLYSR